MRKSKKILILGAIVSFGSLFWLPIVGLLLTQFAIGISIMMYSIHYLINKE